MPTSSALSLNVQAMPASVDPVSSDAHSEPVGDPFQGLLDEALQGHRASRHGKGEGDDELFPIAVGITVGGDTTLPIPQFPKLDTAATSAVGDTAALSVGSELPPWQALASGDGTETGDAGLAEGVTDDVEPASEETTGNATKASGRSILELLADGGPVSKSSAAGTSNVAGSSTTGTTSAKDAASINTDDHDDTLASTIVRAREAGSALNTGMPSRPNAEGRAAATPAPVLDIGREQGRATDPSPVATAAREDVAASIPGASESSLGSPLAEKNSSLAPAAAGSDPASGLAATSMAPTVGAGNIYATIVRADDSDETTTATPAADLKDEDVFGPKSSRYSPVADAVGQSVSGPDKAAVTRFSALLAGQGSEEDTGTGGAADNSALSSNLKSHAGQVATAVLDRASAPVDAARPASASLANPVTPATASTVSLPLAHPGWGDAMSARVVWFASQDIKHASIQLNPADLGPIDIKLAINNGEATVAFNAHHAATRDALEAALPRLRDMFQSQGVQLGQVHVGGQSGQGAQAFSDARSGFASGNSQGGRLSEPVADELEQPVLPQPTRISERVVDFYA